MRVFVTGARGFVGRWLLRRLVAAGHDVTGAIKGDQSLTGAEKHESVRWVGLDLGNRTSADTVLAQPFDALVHLAAVASGAQARDDPGQAWEVNAAGTARLLSAVARTRERGADPLVVLASTGEVYGRHAQSPSRETDPVEPCSPYAASKLGAEIAAREIAGRTGLRLIVVRPFSQCGPGQDTRFFLPALVARLLELRSRGGGVVKVGSLEPVRDFIDVRDAAAAIVGLLEAGESDQTYNIATGRGVRLADLFLKAAEAVGVRADPVTDPALMREADLRYLVGDCAKLSARTGWIAAVPIEQSLLDLVAESRSVAAGPRGRRDG